VKGVLPSASLHVDVYRTERWLQYICKRIKKSTEPYIRGFVKARDCGENTFGCRGSDKSPDRDRFIRLLCARLRCPGHDARQNQNCPHSPQGDSLSRSSPASAAAWGRHRRPERMDLLFTLGNRFEKSAALNASTEPPCLSVTVTDCTMSLVTTRKGGASWTSEYRADV
jgi:hypothetical protein